MLQHHLANGVERRAPNCWWKLTNNHFKLVVHTTKQMKHGRSCPSATFSTSVHHIWMSHSLPCIICIIIVCVGDLCSESDCEQLCADNATSTCGCRPGYNASGNLCVGTVTVVSALLRNQCRLFSYVVLLCTVHVHTFSKRSTGTCRRYFLLRAVN